MTVKQEYLIVIWAVLLLHTHLLILQAELGICILIMNMHFWLIQTDLMVLIEWAEIDGFLHYPTL